MKGWKLESSRHSLSARGISNKVIPPLKKGSLGGKGFFKLSEDAQKAILSGIAQKQGERVAQNKVGALGVLLKRTNPADAKRAMKLKHWVAGEFAGKKDVGYPSGFKKKGMR